MTFTVRTTGLATRVFVAVGVVGWSLATGCSNEITTVTGDVLLDGQLLMMGDSMKGTVVYQPTNQAGPTLVGLIDRRGRYRLAAGSTALVPPGEYRVSVSAVEITASASSAQQPQGRRITPDRYASSAHSGLVVTVNRGENRIDLELFLESLSDVDRRTTEETSLPEGE